MRLILNLGCWGREDLGFTSCSAVVNPILDLTLNSKRNTDIADYLDKVYGLFDKPLYNNVHTALWNIQDKFSSKGDLVFNEKVFKLIEAFCIEHKKCGVYLKLDLGKEKI
jgi:hypothetical protein